MAQQLTFDWPTGVALGVADFFVSPANTLAYHLVRDAGRWPEGKLIVTGPAGCGKSHLARVFASDAGAQVVAATALAPGFLPDAPVVIEDMDRLPADAEEAAFHLHNHMRAARLPLLMTARVAPAQWGVALPDLLSRMQAATLAPIAEPDDALLQALIMKLFADRQLMPPATVISYLASRIERSYAAAAATVAALDNAALADKKPIGLKLARAVLDKSL